MSGEFPPKIWTEIIKYCDVDTLQTVAQISRTFHELVVQIPKYRILSWDMGIYNLAYCLLEYYPLLNQSRIVKWGVIDLLGLSCVHEIRGGRACGQRATRQNKKTGTTYCTSHAKRAGLGRLSKITPTVFEVCRKIPEVLDTYPELLDVDEVVIENQPCLKNPRMKTVQNVVFSYYLIRGVHDRGTINNIASFSATGKLHKKIAELADLPDEGSVKNTYAQRKKMAVAYCQHLIRHNPRHLAFFKSHRKKDDLADCYLQGVRYFIKLKDSGHSLQSSCACGGDVGAMT